MQEVEWKHFIFRAQGKEGVEERQMRGRRRGQGERGGRGAAAGLGMLSGRAGGGGGGWGSRALKHFRNAGFH